MKNNYSGERVFPLMFIIIGVTIFLSGIVYLYQINRLQILNSNNIFGFALLLVGFIIVFTRKGILIDYNNRRIKYYIQILFFKIGKWENILNYSFITVLSINQKSYGYSRTGVQFTERKKINRICLLNENHRNKLKIADFKDLKDAILEAEAIAKNLNLEFTNYRPE